MYPTDNRSNVTGVTSRLAACFLTVGAAVLVATPSVVPATETLPELVVSASRVPLPAEEIGSAVTVITADEIERRQVRFVSDVLRDVPGLAVSRSGTVGAFTQVRMRGAEGNQTLVLIDGVEVNDPSGGSEFDLGNLLAADIERIEVLRGPQSALYGSDAIGGVIHIITKRGGGAPRVSLGGEGGSFDTAQASGAIRGGGERYHFSVGGTGYTTNGVSIAPKSEGNHEEDGYANQTYHVKLGISPIDGLALDLFGRLVDATVDTDAQPAVAGVIKTVDSDDERKTRQRLGRAQARYALFDGDWEHIVGAAINEERADSLTNGATSFEADGEKIRYDYQTNIYVDTPWFADGSHTLSLLAEREDESQVTLSAFGSSDLDITNYGYVAEYRVGLWEALFLSGSIRHDDNDIFKNATTHRVTAAYLFPESGTRLHGSHGTGVKNPTLSELFGFGPNFVPNPNLQPEESSGWDVGIEQSLLDGRVIVDLTYYNNRITDLIQGAGNTAINLTGTSRIEGVEFIVDAELLPDTYLSGQYTFTDGRDANGETLVRRARHIASANVSHRFLGGRAGVNIGLRYNGEQKDFEFSNFFATRRLVTLDDFLIGNVAASYEVLDGVEVFGRIENVFDEEYEEVLGFSEPGIGAFVGVRATLGLD